MLLLRRTMMCTAILLAAVIAADALAARGGGRSGSTGGGRSGSHAASGAGHAVRSGAYHGHRGVGVHVVPRFGAGVVIGAPLLLAPRYYGYAPPPYPYYPMPLVVEPYSQIYIEQDQSVQAPRLVVPEQSYSWYYCAASNAYYPYVQDCPGGWQPVAPQTSQ